MDRRGNRLATSQPGMLLALLFHLSVVAAVPQESLIGRILWENAQGEPVPDWDQLTEIGRASCRERV